MILARKNLEHHISHETPVQTLKKTKVRQRQARGKLGLTFLVFCCFITGVSVAYYYAQVASLGYKLDQLNSQLAEQRLESHGLDQKVTEVSSLKNIEIIATKKLGMIKPDEENVVLVSASSASLTAKTNNEAQNKDQNKESLTLPNINNKEDKEPNPIIQAFADLVKR